ncbi:MAG: hypothetical protein IJ566_05335 [Cardiobacteriaceae bacterium]|nr:hypothetical protein [Cardiobacteriaceae bacterium]
MATDNYKCPGCSAPLSYNPQFQGFKCEYCGRSSTEEELEAFIAQYEEQIEEKNKYSDNRIDDGSEIRQYHCPNCGAEVVCGDTTTAAFCYYCHSPVIIENRLKGDFLPHRIIPFKITQKQAIECFEKWVRGKKLLPIDFTVKRQQDKIIGMYLPYWDCDVDVKVDFQATGIQKHTKRVGNQEETEVLKLDIKRKGELHFNNIRSLSFDKIDTNLINAINPFDDSEQIEFKSAYLAGFQSERHNLDKEEAQKQAIRDAEIFTIDQIAESANCQGFTNQVDNSQFAITDTRYVLLPTYILNYSYKGKNYQFAINGQTGIANGELPLSKPKAFAYSAIFGIIVLILALCGGRWLW